MLKDALLHDLRLACEVLKSGHPMSSYRLMMLTEMIAYDDNLHNAIVCWMEVIQQGIEKLHAIERADVNNE